MKMIEFTTFIVKIQIFNSSPFHVVLKIKINKLFKIPTSHIIQGHGFIKR